MFAAPHPISLQGVITSIPGGARGVNSTLRAMRQMVNHYKTDLDMLTAARGLVFMTPPKDEFAEAQAIFDYVRDMIRYTRDIYNVETLSSPDKTMQTRVGDCDDKSTLLSTLLECVGFPTRFVVTAYANPGEFEHVYVQVFINGEWIDADATEPFSLGYAPPDPASILVEKV